MEKENFIVEILLISLFLGIAFSGCLTEEKSRQRPDFPKDKNQQGNWPKDENRPRDFKDGKINDDNYLFTALKEQFELPESASKEQVLEAMKKELSLPEEASEQEVMTIWREQNKPFGGQGYE